MRSRSSVVLPLCAWLLALPASALPSWQVVDMQGASLMCDSPEFIRGVKDTLYITGGGRVWTRTPEFDVSPRKTTVITFDVQLHYFGDREAFDAASEMILMFSTAEKSDQWDGQEDFHLRIGCDPRETDFYTLVRTADNKVIASSPFLFQPNRWCAMRVELTSATLVAYADDIEVVRADIAKVMNGNKGRVGFMGYRPHPWEVRNLKIRVQEKP